MMTTLFQVAVASAVVTTMLALMSRVMRRDDVSGWHLIWTMVAAGGLGVIPLSVLIPMPALVVATLEWSPASVVRDSVLPVVALVYGLGAVALVTQLVVGMVAVQRLVRRAEPVHGDDRQRLADVLGADAGRCRVHHDLAVPVVAAGRILLPASWTRWPAAQLEGILRHERAHLDRRDAWWTALAALHRAVFWPNPAAWWLAAQVRRCAERACDQAAARVVGAVPYARALVESAREVAADQPRLPQLALGAHEDVTARIDALLTSRPASPRLSPVLLTCIIAVVVSALTMAAQRTGQPGDRGADVHAARHAARH